MMGVMGGNRGQVHFRLPECLVDINRRVPPRLTVIDAGRVLLRNGPSGGNLADVKVFGMAFASRTWWLPTSWRRSVSSVEARRGIPYPEGAGIRPGDLLPGADPAAGR